jgi:hypothetical protein
MTRQGGPTLHDKQEDVTCPAVSSADTTDKTNAIRRNPT